MSTEHSAMMYAHRLPVRMDLCVIVRNRQEYYFLKYNIENEMTNIQ